VVIAQAAAEYGALSTMAAGIESAMFKFEAWIGRGNNAYLVAGAVLLVVILLLRRRR
jgi:LPXTG-motif cell wall-anchored protein